MVAENAARVRLSLWLSPPWTYDNRFVSRPNCCRIVACLCISRDGRLFVVGGSA